MQKKLVPVETFLIFIQETVTYLWECRETGFCYIRCLFSEDVIIWVVVEWPKRLAIVINIHSGEFWYSRSPLLFKSRLLSLWNRSFQNFLWLPRVASPIFITTLHRMPKHKTDSIWIIVKKIYKIFFHSKNIS